MGTPLLPSVPKNTGNSNNPESITNEDNLVVAGAGSVLRVNIGNVSVAQATQYFDKLAKAANGNSAGALAARTQLVQIQQELYAAGYYGAKKPKLGTLSGGGLDATAFRKALIDASNSGQKIGDFLAQSGSTNAATGATTTANTPPSPNETQTVYTPESITDTANTEAQKLVGRNATPAEVQAIADQANAMEAQNTQNALSSDEASTAGNQDATEAGAAQAGNPTAVDSFLAAIKQHESGGNYTAYNKAGGASGAYQYIQTTWTAEATEAGYGQYAKGPASSAPPAVQDAVARYNAMNLFNAHGNWKDAAEAWYYPAWAGVPAKQNSVPYPSLNGTLTIGDYGNQIVAAMGQAGTQTGASAPPASSGVVQAAEAQLGVPYQWGGESPKGAKVGQAGSADQRALAGAFDCSGLVQWAFGQNGVKLPRVAQGQYDATQRVNQQQAQPGDLVFFGDGPNAISHVGIYIGNGQMIDAPHTGADVQVQSINIGEKYMAFGSVKGVHNNSGYALQAAAKLGGTSYLEALNSQVMGAQNGLGSDANNATITDNTPTSVPEVAASYYENDDSVDYQKNNLLNVFGSLKTSLTGPGPGGTGVSVRNTPLSMTPTTGSVS